MDSAGDDYTQSPGSARWADAGSVKTQTVFDAPNGNQYVAIREGASVSYHRLGLQITHVNLQTQTCGLSYLGVWGCDDALKAQIAEYGIAVKLEDMPTADFAGDSQCMTNSYPGAQLVSGETKAGVCVSNIMKSDLSAKENAQRGEIPVYALAYAKLTDGTVLTSDRAGYQDDIGYGLRSAMETMDELIVTQPKRYLRPAVQAAQDRGGRRQGGSDRPAHRNQ